MNKKLKNLMDALTFAGVIITAMCADALADFILSFF